jgi:acyl dehydratase
LLFDAVAAVTPAEWHDRTVHGDHEVTIARPVRVGDVLRARAAVEAVRASKPGTAVVVRIDVSDRDGAPVAVHRAIAIVRGLRPAEEMGPAPAPPAPEPADWPDAHTVPITPDQPARYAAATGDTNAVHVDRTAAQLAGFPDVIAHGLGVFGLAVGVLVERVAAGDVAAVRRVRARFGPPVRPGQDLSVQWAGHNPVSFRTLDAAGVAVLRAGVLELHPAGSADRHRLDLDE